MESAIARQILKFVLHSLLIPFITRHLDEWTTIINKKVKQLIEEIPRDET